MTTLDQIRALDPVTDDELRTATRSRDKVWNDVVSRTQRTEKQATPRPRRAVARRLVPVLVAASLVGGIALTAVQRSGDSHPEALAFAYQGDDLKITVIDLQADTKRFNRELEQQGLKFKLVLVPATPSIVGQETSAGFSDGSNARHVTIGETPAGCKLGVDSSCHIEISVSKDFRGEGTLEIGRPLRPGETAAAMGDLGGPGEPLDGVKYQGLQVSQVLEMLRQRDVTVDEYRVDYSDGSGKDAHSVPGNLYVTQGGLLADGKGILWVTDKLK
ncbi:hypothetical protein [Kribbella lupini]|uniref:DUF5667 domain-containing protein n=1 Tax=Kribbella lupini TaxID=291602 RepID=A0ABN2BFD5_9ACTN